MGGSAPDIVACPWAPLAASDPTRRWALRSPDGAHLFPGLTRPEAVGAATRLGGQVPAAWDRALVEVALPVVVSDGAGPYLVDARGRLVLALGPHPSVAGALVAMGPPDPRHAVGLVRASTDGGWEWVARAEVAPDERTAALDALAAAPDEAAAAAWAEAA